MRLLLPILSPTFVTSKNNEKEKILDKVASNPDFYLPFRQHGPSLANARREIYANVNRLANGDGVGFFNVLAFRGVFFGSPFARSDHYRWFNSLDDWENFRMMEKDKAKEYKGERYYVTKNCYGQTQIRRKLSLLPLYWEQRTWWNNKFNKPEKPAVDAVFKWLTSHQKIDGSDKKKTLTLFSNIGQLTALLICGDLAEAGVIKMPSAEEWAKLISRVGKGSKAGMVMCGFVKDKSSQEELCKAFVSLDLALQHELSDEEKEKMGYNVIMLEHALCKIKRLTSEDVLDEAIYSETSS